MGLTEALIMAGVLPYLLMATGRLQPRKNVEDWRDAYFKSEDARATEAQTSAKVLGYLEAADKILRGITNTGTAQPVPPAPEASDVEKDL